MRKRFILFVFIALALVAGVLAQDAIDSNLDDFVKNAAKTKGVSEDSVKDIKKVDFNDLPNEVKLKNIDETNLALYEIDLGIEKPVYVITASKELFQKTLSTSVARSYLSFGEQSILSSNSRLRTSSGVMGGYTMTRDGSITGISTNLNILENSGNLPIEIIILINNKEVGFRNSFVKKEMGQNSDYDLISPDTIDFNKGDYLSIIVNIPSNNKVNEVSALLEIETK